MAATTGLVETPRSAAPKSTFPRVVEINSPEVAESNCEAKLPKLPERCFSARFLCVLFAETKSKGVKHRQGTRLQPREFHRPPSLFQQMVCSRCAMLPTRSFSSPGFRRAPVKLHRAELLAGVAEGSRLPGLPVYLGLGSPGRPATLRTPGSPRPAHSCPPRPRHRQSPIVAGGVNGIARHAYLPRRGERAEAFPHQLPFLLASGSVPLKFLFLFGV